MPVRPSSFVLLACVVAAIGCKRSESPSAEPGAKERHDTVATDREAKDIERLPEADLLARARRSAECGSLEPVPCDDAEIVPVRCELSKRAKVSKILHGELLRDAHGADRAKRGAALRVLADLGDDGSVRAVHDALVDSDPSIACRAAAYAIWLRKEDKARLDELAGKCDGAPVIRATSEALARGTTDVVQVGVTCDDLRAAGR